MIDDEQGMRHDNIPLVSRKVNLFGRAVPTLLMLSVLLGCRQDTRLSHEISKASDILQDTPQQHVTIRDDLQFQIRKDIKAPVIDLRQRTKEIFSELTARNIETEAKKVALLSHVVDIEAEGGNSASGFMIDQSGIVVTAAHTFLNGEGKIQPKVTVVFTTLQTAKGEKVQGYPVTLLDVDAVKDIAILYAPTGKPQHTSTDLQIRSSPLTEGERVIAIGHTMFIDPKTSNKDRGLYIVTGRIDRGTTEEVKTYFPAHIGVKDMKPVGGISGGPVIDSNGNIVAVLRGSLNGEKGENEASKYRGGIISPMTDFIKGLK